MTPVIIIINWDSKHFSEVPFFERHYFIKMYVSCHLPNDQLCPILNSYFFFYNFHRSQMLLLPKYQHSSRYLSANLHTKSQIVKYYTESQDLQVWAQQESSGAVYMSYLYSLLYSTGFCKCKNVFI